MGVISFVEFLVRGSDSREHAKPSALLHRPTEREFDHFRDGTPKVFQQLRLGVPRSGKSHDHLRRVDFLGQLFGEEDRQKFGRVIWLAIEGIWELFRQCAIGVWKGWSGEVGEGVDFGGNE